MDQQNVLEGSMPKMDNLIWRVFKLFLKNKKQILDRLDLTCSQYEILSAIYFLMRVRPEVIQIDLSEKAFIDPMTTSTILRNLQKKGLIKRNRSLVNTRTIIVELTPIGVVLFENACRQLEAYSEMIFEGINQKHLTSQLTKLSHNLNKLNY